MVVPAVRGLVATSTAVLAALLVAGTLVTAAGPHAGDAATPRLGLGVPATAQLHADLDLCLRILADSSVTEDRSDVG